ncbi:hypothetical protein CLOBOL_05071 [Enterocloster bolteae ATCC BAA-613]|uniref:Uncharacterized protein n=1 Tax=Enterocloster bolteae (strain ATCC BAA-613 / DSM 15670 / CCUG 46953 / JCM 12243 / WAL 16351) TaxID=411902 RepID=A8RYA5_ENTBW|nr:hypothetical protein CLOBOL_05071 [Enterocloster bolteae ATCC BAA-613]
MLSLNDFYTIRLILIPLLSDIRFGMWHIRNTINFKVQRRGIKWGE